MRFYSFRFFHFTLPSLSLIRLFAHAYKYYGSLYFTQVYHEQREREREREERKSATALQVTTVSTCNFLTWCTNHSIWSAIFHMPLMFSLSSSSIALFLSLSSSSPVTFWIARSGSYVFRYFSQARGKTCHLCMKYKWSIDWSISHTATSPLTHSLHQGSCYTRKLTN